MIHRLLALVIAWNLAGVLRVAAVFVLDRHVSLGFRNLASADIMRAFFGEPYLVRSIVALVCAFVIGEVVTGIFSRTRRWQRTARHVAGPVVSLAVFWALIAFGEIIDRTSLINTMTNEIELTRRHFAILLVSGAIAALSFAIWIAVMRAGRYAGRIVAIACVLLCLSAVAPRLILGPAQANENMPNVVLITIDTLRADHVSAYGYPRQTTPNLDALAKSGTLYLNALSQAPNTHPSMASMTTSAYPTDLGGKLRYIPPRLATMAETFLDAGYATAAVVSNVWLKRSMGFDAGFQHFDETSAMSEFYADAERIEWKGADFVSDAAIAWLKDNRARPFFLWIHYLDPHHPYDPPARVRDRFASSRQELTAYLDEVGSMPTREQTHWLSRIGSGEIDISQARFQAIIDLYDAEILYTDEQIGRVLRELDKENTGDTIVAVTADHGEEFRDHGRWGHSHTLHRELVHVPLIVHDSRETGGLRRTDRVRVIDIAPTLLRAAGIPVPPSMRGSDLKPDSGDRDAISVLTKQDLFAIEWQNWKMISRDYGAEIELYDLKADPEELVNVAAAHPDIATKMQALLNDELGVAARAESMNATAENLQEGTRKQLEALGYFD